MLCVLAILTIKIVGYVYRYAEDVHYVFSAFTPRPDPGYGQSGRRAMGITQTKGFFLICMHVREIIISSSMRIEKKQQQVWCRHLGKPKKPREGKKTNEFCFLSCSFLPLTCCGLQLQYFFLTTINHFLILLFITFFPLELSYSSFSTLLKKCFSTS